MTITLREAVIADIPAVTMLYKALHRRHVEYRDDYYLMPADEYFTARTEKAL